MKAVSLIALAAAALGASLVLPAAASAAGFGAAAGLGSVLTPSVQLTACSSAIDPEQRIWLAAACGDGGGSTGSGNTGTSGSGTPDPTGGTVKPHPNVRHKFD